MPKYTEHYQLIQPGAEEFYDVANANENMGVVDQALFDLKENKLELDSSGKVGLPQLPTIPVGKGGTGTETLLAGQYLVGNGVAAVQTKSPAQVCSDIGAVPMNRTINGYALIDHINLNAADVNAVPSSRKINNLDLTKDISLTAADVNAVPTNRTINGKALTGNIALTASDVGARASTWMPTAAQVGALPTTGGSVTGAVTFGSNVSIGGNVVIKGSGNYGNKLNFGDGDFVHLYEISDDNLEIKAKNLNFLVSGSITKNGEELGGSVKFTSGYYTGTGTTSRKISLNFTPKAVFVYDSAGRTTQSNSYYVNGGLAVTSSGVVSSGVESYEGIYITTNGFYVLNEQKKDSFAYGSSMNVLNSRYHYCAFG